ncbi:carbon-nitrogen hydrolase family protein [Streptomyces sp. NPDC001493]
MTANRNFKRRVRARAAKTGESYTTALRHFRTTSSGKVMPETTRVRLAVAQSVVHANPSSERQLHENAREVRRLMREAHRAGARIVHFPEGATCSPTREFVSESRTESLPAAGPETTGPETTDPGTTNPGTTGPEADWSRVAWEVLREELAATARLAGGLGMWVVLGSVHRLSGPHRPHNSLYVISDRGELVTRYDERMLSRTKVSSMYAPGSAPVTFEVDGLRFGCLLGMEVHFPELFGEYEQLDVDCVLFSTTGGGTPSSAVFAVEAQAHAAINGYWVSFAVHARPGATAPSGVVAPGGEWIGRCEADGRSSVTVVELNTGSASAGFAANLARPWRRTARAGVYEPHLVRDSRSEDRSSF